MNDLPEFNSSAFWQEPDFLLTELVSLFANTLDAELGVTLMVGGAVISGTLIGEQAYLKAVNGLVKRLARDLMDKPTADDLQTIAGVFDPDRLAEDFLPAGLEAVEADGAGPSITEVETDLLMQTPPLRYLHLRDPILIQPGATLNFSDSELPVMRLRMTQVEGWIVGRASVISNDSFDDDFPPGGIIH